MDETNNKKLRKLGAYISEDTKIVVREGLQERNIQEVIFDLVNDTLIINLDN